MALNHKGDMILADILEAGKISAAKGDMILAGILEGDMISEANKEVLTSAGTIFTRQLQTSVIKSAQEDTELLILVLVILSAAAWLVIVIISTQDLFQLPVIIWQVQSAVARAGKADSTSFTFESHL